MNRYAIVDEALEFLAPYGPDLRNGLTSHAPMAVEAMAAMGRPDAVMPWLAQYRKGLMPRPAGRAPIDARTWREALGHEDRFADWHAFFAAELGEAPWRDVVARWVGRLSPAICASAMHGVIRVGHAVRSLENAETPRRLGELAEGLGYWAAAYQTLPTAPAGSGSMRPAEAIASVPVVPASERTFTGTIVGSLAALGTFPAFAPVIGMIDVERDPVPLVSELSETFTRIYLANAHDFLTTIVFVHAVTSATAVRSLLPIVPEGVAREAIRHLWQAECALYAAFGTAPARADDVESPEEPEALVDLAITNGDEHAIKFTEACLREHALNPSPAYLAAARHAIGMLAVR